MTFLLKVPWEMVPLQNAFYISIPFTFKFRWRIDAWNYRNHHRTLAQMEPDASPQQMSDNQTLFHAITTLFSPLPIFIMPGEHYSSIGGKECGKPDNKY